MNIRIINQKGFKEVILTIILITCVSLLTFSKKELFVHETGTMQLYGGIGVLLAFGLLWKWRYVRGVLLFITGFWVLGTLFSGWQFYIEGDIERGLNNLILAAVEVVILLLLMSKSLREYLKSKK